MFPSLVWKDRLLTTCAIRINSYWICILWYVSSVYVTHMYACTSDRREDNIRRGDYTSANASCNLWNYIFFVKLIKMFCRKRVKLILITDFAALSFKTHQIQRQNRCNGTIHFGIEQNKLKNPIQFMLRT